MMVLLFLAAVSLVLGGPLTQQENDDLQRMCGVSSQGGRYRRSMNSNPATRYAAPFTVLIHESLEDGTPRERLSDGMATCTGTIISPRHILTAAHCIGSFNCRKDGSFYVTQSHFGIAKLFEKKLNYLFVSAPTNCQDGCDTMMKNLIVKPKRAFISNEYIKWECRKDSNNRGDVAVIELEEDIPFMKTVQPACLYTKKVQENTQLTIYGYGISSENDMGSGRIMRKHEATTAPGAECNDFMNKAMNISEITVRNDEICLKSYKEMACKGDSGSGLILSQNRLAYVAAVTSWGPPCLPEVFGNFANTAEVSSGLYHHLDWICAATGICPKGHLLSSEKDQLTADYVEMGLAKDFKLERARYWIQ